MSKKKMITKLNKLIDIELIKKIEYLRGYRRGELDNINRYRDVIGDVIQREKDDGYITTKRLNEKSFMYGIIVGSVFITIAVIVITRF
jgi:hypothetical protein